MSEELSHILAECIEAIEDGRLTVDECLDAYPRHRVELSELLSVALGVRAVPTMYAPPEFRHEARAQLLAKLPPRAADSNGRVSDGYLSGTLVVWSALAQRLQATKRKAAQRWPWSLRPSLVAAAVLLFVVILLSSLWLRGRSPAAQEGRIVQESPSSPATETEATIQEQPSESGLAVDLGSEETAGAIPPDEKIHAWIPFISAPLSLDAQTAAVEASQGIVEVQNGEGEWLAVNQATSVTEGQRVRTGAFSGATITFYDGSQASLGPNSEISLDQVDALRPEDGFRTVVMTQWAGESEHHVDFRNDAGSRYEVQSANGSGRARGTVFQVIVTPEQLTQYIVTEGRVDVTHLNVTVVVTAGQVSIVEPEEPPSQPYFTISGQGEVTAMGETWTVGGQSFAATDSTLILGDPQIGDIVAVYGYMLPDGTLVATHIILRHQTPANHFSLTGLVESIGVDEWTVAGRAIAVNDETIIDETVDVGDLARIQGIILAADGTLLAQRIDPVDESLPFEFVGVVNNIAAGAWNISGLDITVDDSTEIEGDISVGDVVKVEGEILASGAWLAHKIRLRDDEGSEFEFTGLVEGIDPWLVSGISFEVDAFTEIDGGIEVGDLVHVEGQILADGTWLAAEIQLLSDDDLTFAFIGLVGNIDPWVVSGVPLTVDEDTIIDDDIAVGDLVRVRGLVLPDGKLLATLIERLDDDEDPAGCYTVTTTVLGVDGDQVTLKGWPPLTLHDDSLVEGTITPNANVTVSICLAEDGSVTIISIVVIVVNVPPKPPGPLPPGAEPGGDGYSTICHKPGTPAEQTKTLPRSALYGHLSHGDFLGPCR